MKTIPAGFGIEQRGGHPALAMIAALLTFSTPADGLDYRKAGFDSASTAQRRSKAVMHL